MKRKGSPETKRNGDPQIFLTAPLQILARFSGVCWLEHPQARHGSALEEGATGRNTWSSDMAGEGSSADFKGAGVFCQLRILPITLLFSCRASTEVRETLKGFLIAL